MPRKQAKKAARIIETKPSYLEQVESTVQSNQSKVSLILGALIVLVAGVLLFNYFSRNNTEVGPANQTEQTQEGQDVSPENLPGKYTVKENDTLFTLAEKYYNDGHKYTEIVQANNLSNENVIEVGQVLEIPKLESTPAATPAPTEDEQPIETPATQEETISQDAPTDEKGATTTSEFGPAITGNTYTVVEGDWLSTIAARAYGDVMAYQKIAEANNISNPDLIIPGQVLNLPR